MSLLPLFNLETMVQMEIQYDESRIYTANYYKQSYHKTPVYGSMAVNALKEIPAIQAVTRLTIQRCGFCTSRVIFKTDIKLSRIEAASIIEEAQSGLTLTASYRARELFNNIVKQS